MIAKSTLLPSMSMMAGILFGAVVLGALARDVAAQQGPPPPIRQLGEASVRSTEKFGALVSVRAISGGLLVNDVRNRRVVLLDSTLSRATVVADTTAATANAYSGQLASLIAYREDSTLFVDPQSMSMLVIDPSGQVGRVMSVPRSQDAMMFAMGGAAYDGRGSLVYRGSPFGGMQMRRAVGGPGGFQPPEIPDTTPVLRVELASRRVDTLGFVKVPPVKMDVQRDTMGRVSVSAIVNPLPTVDDFAVLSDGSVALIRGRDYHIDWIRPDAVRESTPKIPFEWRRLTEEDKIAFLDSVKAARQRMDEQSRAQRAQADSASHGRQGGRGQPDMVGAMAGGGPPGGVRVQIGGPGGGAGPMMGGTAGLNLVQASDLPDYQPVFFSGSARADADGNLWVRTIPSKNLPGGPVYDVINGKGQLVDRVQVPRDRTIAGFAPGGVVYLSMTQDNGTTLERAAYRRN